MAVPRSIRVRDFHAVVFSIEESFAMFTGAAGGAAAHSGQAGQEGQAGQGFWGGQLGTVSDGPDARCIITPSTTPRTSVQTGLRFLRPSDGAAAVGDDAPPAGTETRVGRTPDMFGGGNSFYTSTFYYCDVQ
eukprot:Hpha_TRINITY_DN10647_c0_g3::TRINITY_DN10647_c0_g3_i1::g.156945::m.156945